MQPFYCYAMDINGTTLDGIQDKSTPFGIRMFRVGGDGKVQADFGGVEGQQSGIDFTTVNLKTALDYCGLDGLAISANSLITYWQAGADGSTRGGASTHFKEEHSKGYLYPVSIRASMTPPATITYRLVSVWDGTNEPILFTADQTASLTMVSDEIYCVGPLKINGVSYTDVQDVTINFGITEDLVGGAGEVWTRYGGQKMRRPSITCTLKDVETAATIGYDGVAIASATGVFLRKCTADHTRVAAGTATHMYFGVSKGHVGIESIRASGLGTADMGVVITPVYDQSNAEIAATTAIAIT